TLIAAALRCSAAGTSSSTVLSPRVTSLSDKVLRAMFINKLRMSSVILIAVTGVILAGVGLTLGLRAHAGPEGELPNAKQASPAQAADGLRDNKQSVSDDIPRTVTVIRPVQSEAAPYQDYTGR